MNYYIIISIGNYTQKHVITYTNYTSNKKHFKMLRILGCLKSKENKGYGHNTKVKVLSAFNQGSEYNKFTVQSSKCKFTG